MGGLLTGVLANPAVIEYIGTGKDAPGVSGTGWAYGSFHQFVVQAEAAGFIIVFNIIATSIILFVIKIFVPLRMDEATLKIGDDAVHGETAYAIGAEGE
jgi:Amt family ammonium transporter